MLKPSVMSDLKNLDLPFKSAISPRPKPSTSLRSELSLTTSPTAEPPAVVAGDVCDRQSRGFRKKVGALSEGASGVNFHHTKKTGPGTESNTPGHNPGSARTFRTARIFRTYRIFRTTRIFRTSVRASVDRRFSTLDHAFL